MMWLDQTDSKRQLCAVKTLQEAWRNRLTPAKKNTFRWPTLFELKAMYLDAEAVAAGAEGAELYTNSALQEREMLRRHPAVVGALEETWAAMVPEGSGGMDKQMYWATFRKLYLHMMLGQAPDPHDVTPP